MKGETVVDLTNLIKRCQLGDLEGFTELYRLYSHRVMKTAYLITGYRCIAEDIMQEAFLQCFLDIKKLKHTEIFNIWFHRVIMRTSWKIVTKYSKITPVEDITSYMPDTSDEQISLLDLEDTSLSIHQALKKLSPDHKAVLIMHYYNDLSIPEISKVIGCFQGTVKSRLYNARKQLKELLNEKEFDAAVNIVNGGKECKIN
jgi:RNA polymerase sigma factor (sigma-70 family)